MAYAAATNSTTRGRPPWPRLASAALARSLPSRCWYMGISASANPRPEADDAGLAARVPATGGVDDLRARTRTMPPAPDKSKWPKASDVLGRRRPMRSGPMRRTELNAASPSKSPPTRSHVLAKGGRHCCCRRDDHALGAVAQGFAAYNSGPHWSWLKSGLSVTSAGCAAHPWMSNVMRRAIPLTRNGNASEGGCLCQERVSSTRSADAPSISLLPQHARSSPALAVWIRERYRETIKLRAYLFIDHGPLSTTPRRLN